MTNLPTFIVQNPTLLASHLAEHDFPGRRSQRAIATLRAERRRRNAPIPVRVPLSQRVHTWLLDRATAEIHRRGGETEIKGKYGTTYVDISDRQNRMVLMHAEGWRAYGRSPARWVGLSYLWGPDDAGSGPWAVRVPGTVTTVADAVSWLTPATVKKAQQQRLRVRRQGDVYAIETTPGDDGNGADRLPKSHEWRHETRHLLHRPEDGRRHRALRLPWPVQFVPQTAYEMGRTNRRADAD